MKLSILFSLWVFLFGGEPEKPKAPISCGVVQQVNRATIASVKSGNWSDAATWGGVIPKATDMPQISAGTVVVADVDASIAGIQIDGMLSFANSKSVTIQSTANIVVTGKLEILNPNPNFIQTIRFTGINETKFVGGGMDVLATDVGLWVMGDGVLNIQGAYKTSFVNANSTLEKGVKTIALKTVPTGWAAGDEIAITPTANNDSTFDETKIQTISGSTLTSTSSLIKQHPIINNSWTAEIMNLTRNVRIEGTATGRTHVFIRSTKPQSILNVQLRYVGPRKEQSGDDVTELVPGRYGIHFHHCMSGSVGSIVDGCVVRDAGNHSYVPHISDGITMSHNIAYNVLETAFWWDFQDVTNNTKWIGNIVANVNFLNLSIGIDNAGTHTFGTNGFILGVGDDNICDSNVVVCQYGLNTTNSAYDWEEEYGESVWRFVGNIAHNCDNGIRSWQNNEKIHIIKNSILYNNKMGIFHGAYVNNYTYDGNYLYNSTFEDHASSADNGVKIYNMTMDGAGLLTYPFKVIGGPGNGLKPVFMRACTIKGGTKGAILDSTYQGIKNLDIIQCNITGDIKFSSDALSGETIRIQPTTGQPIQLKKSGTTNISAFAPTMWGNGTGLKTEYFNNVDFTAPALTRIEPVVMFREWWDRFALPGSVTGVHHLITDDTYSVRFTGYIEPQYNETYTFKVEFGGGVRLYVDGVLIIDKWLEAYPNTYTSKTIALQAGKKYSIKLEYFNDDNNTQLLLYWQSPSLKQEVVPQSQLYPSDSVIVPPPPVNKPPVANAGTDLNIQLPISSVTLNGSNSIDSDGSIVSYAWTKVSGPTNVNIATPNYASTLVTGLVAGTYTFRLTVTDDKGAVTTDDVNVTVTAAPVNQAPTANAGTNETITLQFTLSGSGTDSDGTIASYLWEKISGPTCNIVTPNQKQTTVNQLTTGVYVFRLTVTDNQGATATATVTKTVQ
jgi:hypothetical protein